MSNGDNGSYTSFCLDANALAILEQLRELAWQKIKGSKTADYWKLRNFIDCYEVMRRLPLVTPCACIDINLVYHCGSEFHAIEGVITDEYISISLGHSGCEDRPLLTIDISEGIICVVDSFLFKDEVSQLINLGGKLSFSLESEIDWSALSL